MNKQTNSLSFSNFPFVFKPDSESISKFLFPFTIQHDGMSSINSIIASHSSARQNPSDNYSTICKEVKKMNEYTSIFLSKMDAANGVKDNYSSLMLENIKVQSKLLTCLLGDDTPLVSTTQINQKKEIFYNWKWRD